MAESDRESCSGTLRSSTAPRAIQTSGVCSSHGAWQVRQKEPSKAQRSQIASTCIAWIGLPGGAGSGPPSAAAVDVVSTATRPAA